MRHILSLIIFLSISQCTLGQRLPDNGFHKIRITTETETIVLEVLPTEGPVKADGNKRYFWYDANRIHQTLGGYSGKLLNGNYQAYYPNKNLKDAVVFNEGLPNAKWKKWDESGNLTSVITWSNGRQTGPYVLYDQDGRISEEGFYKDGLRNGKVKFYSIGDSVKTVRYKLDKPVERSKPFLKRLMFFKKDKNKLK